MAKGSLDKPSDMATAIISRSESIAIIQTCLHGCLGAVLHARNILPEKAFVHKKIELGEPKQNVEMIILKKGPSTRANHLLNWLVCAPLDRTDPTDVSRTMAPSELFVVANW